MQTGKISRIKACAVKLNNSCINLVTPILMQNNPYSSTGVSNMSFHAKYELVHSNYSKLQQI